ncbi:MAG: D-amino-acid transaminase [Methyloligellaceae bacterium]
MARVIFVNGQYQVYDNAVVHVEDRGFQFADGVYEVCEVRNRKLVDETRHIDRLHRSMHELQIRPPMARSALAVVMREVIRRNRVQDGLVYLQVTRGVAKRDFIFPDPAVPSSLICYARKVSRAANDSKANAGVGVITMPDNRWSRPDIKSVSLLPNLLARQAAQEAGCHEAWLVDGNGYITEGAASNAWIVTADDLLQTRSAETGILKGVTRSVVIDLLKREGIGFLEEPFKEEDVIKAKEAFSTSATALVMPVVRINNKKIGTGVVGPITKMLREQFHTQAEMCP